jgi:RNA polymerase sigma factor (sigma-70 family)
MSGFQKGRGDPRRLPEITLIMQAQSGCSESLNEVMEQHEGLVRWVVQRQWLLTLSYEDALQAGRQGLWHAILRYDPGRGASFVTYACKVIMIEVWVAVKCERRRLGREIPLPILVLYYYQSGPNPAQLSEQQEVSQELLALVDRLPERSARIITAYYGLRGQEAQTLQAIGNQLGLTKERIRQLRNAALVWLRQPAHSQELRSLLARHNQQQYEWADQVAQAWLKRRGGRHGRR